MGICHLTAAEIRKHLPARILSLGFPDHLHNNVDLTGSSLLSVDIFQHHGDEVISDLSLTNSLQSLGMFDVVLDCGTLEHCSNIANAFINAASAVRPCGVILHHLPLNHINHGYWNINPRWFSDFYRHNHFTLERMDMNWNGNYWESEAAAWPEDNPLKKEVVLLKAAMTLCVARRTTANPVTLPLCEQQWIRN